MELGRSIATIVDGSEKGVLFRWKATPKIQCLAAKNNWFEHIGQLDQSWAGLGSYCHFRWAAKTLCAHMRRALAPSHFYTLEYQVLSNNNQETTRDGVA